MYKARVRLPPKMDKLLRSDWEKIIWEANLGRDDTIIITRYILEWIPQADIAEEFHFDRSTVSKRIAGILHRLDFVAEKLGLYQ